MPDYDKTFPEGMHRLVPEWQKRRRPLLYAEGQTLPPLDVDLDALQNSHVPSEVPDLDEATSSFERKAYGLRSELQGCSELAYLNAILIVNLRKREWPEHAPALFHRLWMEKGDALLDELSGRWLISSMITFAEHGPTDADRRVGQSLNMLFSIMKLYEAERQYSGLRADEPFMLENRVVSPLPMGMPQFSLLDGDLEVNLLGPIAFEARQATVAGPLAKHLLKLINLDDSNIFRRMADMRKRAIDPEKPQDLGQD